MLDAIEQKKRDFAKLLR